MVLTNLTNRKLITLATCAKLQAVTGRLDARAKLDGDTPAISWFVGRPSLPPALQPLGLHAVTAWLGRADMVARHLQRSMSPRMSHYSLYGEPVLTATVVA